MKNKRKHRICWIFPYQAAMLAALLLLSLPMPAGYAVLTVPILLDLFICMALSAYQMQLFTRTTTKVSAYGVDYTPYLGDVAALICLDLLLFSAAQRLGGNFEACLLWFIIQVIILVLCALLTFVIGVARTMLYHEERPK